MSTFLDAHVDDYMTCAPITAATTTSLRQLETLFEERDYNIIPVMGDGRMLGLVTKYDFLKAFALSTKSLVPNYEALMALTAGDVMTRTVLTIEPQAPLSRALQLMVEHKLRSLPVTIHGQLIGVISRGDIMRALRETTPLADAA